jgi:hypothetical protein
VRGRSAARWDERQTDTTSCAALHRARSVGALSDAVALVNQLYDLWNERDLDAAVALGADDIEITLVAYGQTFAVMTASAGS